MTNATKAKPASTHAPSHVIGTLGDAKVNALQLALEKRHSVASVVLRRIVCGRVTESAAIELRDVPNVLGFLARAMHTANELRWTNRDADMRAVRETDG